MRDCLGMLKNWYVVNRETGEIVKIMHGHGHPDISGFPNRKQLYVADGRITRQGN
jgi:hypothetical protein